MAALLTPEQQESAQRYSLELRHWADQEAVRGEDNSLPGRINVLLREISHRYSISQTHISLYEKELQDAWYMLIKAAQNMSPKSEGHLKLLYVILYYQNFGTLTRTITNDNESDTKEIAQTSDGIIYSDLPFLARDLVDAFHQINKLDMTQREKYSSFLAQAVSIGIGGNSLIGCAISLFRDALEVPRKLLASEKGPEQPLEEFLPLTKAWLECAGHKLVALANKSFDEVSPEDSEMGELARQSNVVPGGINPSRWLCWTKRYKELSMNDHEKIALLATDGFEMMSDLAWEIPSFMRSGDDWGEYRDELTAYLRECRARFPKSY